MKRLNPLEGYDRYAGDYRKDHPLLDSFMGGAELDVWERSITEQLDLSERVNAVELGCGDGRTLGRCARRILNRGWTERVTLCGTDFSPKMLDRARKRVEGEVHLLDATDIDACRAWVAQRGRAEVLSAWFLLVHVMDLATFFSAVDELLAPGGFLIANTIPQPSAPELRAAGKPIVIEAWDHRAEEVAKVAEQQGWIEWERQNFYDKDDLTSTLFGWQKPLNLA